MGLLHKDEPVADATVNCPECRAIDWVIRTPRLVGEPSIVCRACEFVQGPYFPAFEDGESDEEAAARGREHLAAAPFAVYVPDGLPWEPTGWFAQDEVRSVTVACEDPWVSVTTEPVGFAPEPPEALRDAMMDLLADEGPAPGRSQAAYLLEIGEQDARIEEQVGDLAIENGTLRVDGASVPCKLMAAGEAWAAYATVGDVVVVPGAVGVPVDRVALVRHG